MTPEDIHHLRAVWRAAASGTVLRVFPARANPCIQLRGCRSSSTSKEETLAWIQHAVQRGGPPVAQALREGPALPGADLEDLLKPANDRVETER